MADEWKEYSLGDIATFAYGKMPKSNTLTEGQYPTFSGYKYQYKYPEYNCDKGDVIVVARGVGGTGDVKVVKERCYLTNLSIKITLDNEIADNRYFYYNYLNSSLRHLDSGSAQSQITINDLNRESIPLPPLSEQKAIAHILGSLDDKIELNRKMNETLEEMARAIFKSWFVDFDPVKAKAEGRQPEGMDAETAKLFPDSFEDSELGMIPKGWKVGTIGNEVDVSGGGTPSTKRSEFWDDGTYHWATPKDLSGLNDKVLLNTGRLITAEGLASISSGLLPKDTVLLSSRAPVGYLALTKVPTAINQGFIAMQCNQSLSPEFILLWTESVMAVITQRASGTTFAEISKKNFKTIPLVVPNALIVNRFSEKVVAVYETITANILQTKSLTEIRDRLLPKLLSGIVRTEGIT